MSDGPVHGHSVRCIAAVMREPVDILYDLDYTNKQEFGELRFPYPIGRMPQHSWFRKRRITHSIGSAVVSCMHLL